MNARAHPYETDSIGWRVRHAGALLGNSASRLMRVLAVALAVVFAGLGWLVLATVDKPERLSMALFLSGIAVAALWGLWFSRLLLLHIEAHQSRMPGVGMAIAGTISLAFIATVLLPSLLLASGGVNPGVAVCAMTLAASVGVLTATLPRIAYIALCLAPLGIGLLHGLYVRVVPAGAVTLPALQMQHVVWLVGPALALAGWRWFAIVRRAPADATSIWWQPALFANPRTGGGFNWALSGDAASAQLPDWMWPAGQTAGAGPDRPVRAMRALMGTPFAPLSGGQILIQLGIGVLVVAYLVMNTTGENANPGTLVGGAIGGIAVMVVMYAQRLEAMYRKPGGELDELALLPGLGEVPERRATLLSAVARAPVIAMALMLLVLVGLGLITGVAPRMVGLMVMAGIGVALTTALACLRPVAGLRMNGWRMLVLAGPTLLLAMGTILYAAQAKGIGYTPLVLALAWVLAYALLVVAIASAWRRLHARPHPLLVG
ncbi:hypothetical protein [Lysobacter sp. F6437]|uniref:hypothetical protein n=1 Tax=Lysobacter sp. F6437 TaxID=3459296 RepID=UPI00403D94C1